MLPLTYISSIMIRQNEYCRVSARKCTRRTGEAVGNALMVVNVQMYAKRSMRSLLWIAQLLRTDRCRVSWLLFCRYIPFTEFRSVIYNALAS